MNVETRPYRMGFENGRLAEAELDIRYNQLGGPACLPAGHEDGCDCACPVCRQEMRLVLQYVTPCSTEEIHRVLYVFLCNSEHFAESLRVYTYVARLGQGNGVLEGGSSHSAGKASQVSQKSAEPAPVSAKGSALAASPLGGSLLAGCQDDLLSLVSGFTASAPKAAPSSEASAASLAVSPAAAPPASSTAAPALGFTLRGSGAAYDISMKPCDVVVADAYSRLGLPLPAGVQPPPRVAKGAKDSSDSEGERVPDSFSPLELLQLASSHACFISGHGRDPLARPAEVSGIREQLPRTGLVHELDILPSTVALLGFPRENSAYAEYKCIYVYTDPSLELGWHLGAAVAVPEDDISQLLPARA